MVLLEEVLVRLWRANIHAGVTTVPSAHIKAWIRLDGKELTKEFHDGGRHDDVARWLADIARGRDQGVGST